VLEAAVKEVLLEQDATFFEKYDEVRGAAAAAPAAAEAAEGARKRPEEACL
jgi:hypothetical protein